MNRKTLILIALFILSRVIFINPLPVFFDSPEYLSRFSDPNYFQAIVSGHMPFHASYLLIFWPIFKLATLVGFNPAFAVIFMQVIFSALAIYSFYRFIAMISDRKIATIAAIISSLTPLYWVANDSIMVESTYINLFLISLFSFAHSVKIKSSSNLYLLAGCVTLGLALLTNFLVILWTPLLFAVIFFLKKERIKNTLPFALLTILTAILINGFFVANFFHLPLLNGVHQYLFGEDLNLAPTVNSSLTILRFIRNAFIPIFQSNTGIILLLNFIALITLFKTNKKLLLISLLWILPAVITSQWFDPLLLGRHEIISVFGFGFLAAVTLEKRKMLFVITIGYLLITSLPALSLLKQPIPYIETGRFSEKLTNGLLVESHFARPQVEGHFPGMTIFVNEPGWSKEKLKSTIDSYLMINKPVFVTSQALSDPYGLYTGPFVYSLGLSYTKRPELFDIFTGYSTERYASIDANAGLFIYKVKAKNKSVYPEIPRLNYNRHRIDYFDPMTQLWLLVERAKIVQIQNIIKG